MRLLAILLLLIVGVATTAAAQTTAPDSYIASCSGVDDTAALSDLVGAVPNGSRIIIESQCVTTGQVNIEKPLDVECRTGGEISGGGNFYTFLITSSDVHFDGCLINGNRTGSDFAANYRAIQVSGSSSSPLTGLRFTNLTISNFKDTALEMKFVDGARIENNNLSYLSYAGLMCEACTNTIASGNKCYQIGSSDGPNSAQRPVATKTNAYCIAFTFESASGLRSHDDIVDGNYCDWLATWHCFDGHAVYRVSFLNNHCTNMAVCVYVTTDGVSMSSTDVQIVGNFSVCAPLGSPTYPGGSGISVGMPAIYLAGYSPSNPANGGQIARNIIVMCGSSESATTPYACIDVNNVHNLDISNNIEKACRFRGIRVSNMALGKIIGNDFNGQSAGPLNQGNILIDVKSTTTQLLISDNWSNSSGSDAMCVPSTIGGIVAVARSNMWNNMANTYSASCGGSSYRTDLGASVP